MKTILSTLITLFFFSAYGQGNYEKAMGEALTVWKSGNSTDAMARFERIAQAEKDNWIPKYYQAFVAITSSFEKEEKEKLQLLDIANKLIPMDEKSSNAEWHVLKALALTSQLTIDPMGTAMVLSPQIVTEYEKALALEPDNPRAISGLANFNIQSKKYMGGDTKEECKDLEKAVSLFNAEKHEQPFYPSWGKDRAEMLLKDCK